MPNYHNDFPDWDTEEWFVFVIPNIPTSLIVAVALCLLVLVGAIVLAMRKRHEATRNSNSYSSSSGDRQREGYTSLDTVERDHNNSTTNASWL